MKKRLWWVLVALAAVTVSAAAASPRINPDITSPFGSADFTASFLQSPAPNPNLAPPWSPITLCGQILGSPKLLYADDPEQWTYNPIGIYPATWTYTNPGQPQVTVNNLLLEQGNISSGGSGLIYWYFENELGVTARLYIGGISTGGSTATFSYTVKQNVGSSGGAVKNGATQTSNFLGEYVTGTGLVGGQVSSGSSPTAVKTYSLTDGQIAQGEMYVTNLSGPATFYIYADDCSGTPCPDISNINLKGDGHKRRGNFVNASFNILHNYNPALETGSGGFSWYDLVSASSCVDILPGNDPFNTYNPRNSGDYGVPITIIGKPDGAGGGTEFSQYWFMTGSPAGNAPGVDDAFGVYVQGLVDDSTGVDVTGNWAVPFPASNPPTPSPQPTDVPMPCCAESANLGLDTKASSRTITWIPSGGDTLPARFWYNIPALADLKKMKHIERYH